MYFLINLLTAPGVAIHELGHAFFCWLARVKIYKIKLFQFDKKIAGYVTHDEPKFFIQALFISFGPLLVNSTITLLLFAKISRHYSVWFSGLKTGDDLSLLWLWLGVAVGLHAIPSTGDAETLFHISTNRWWLNPLKLVGLPFVALLYILNWLKRLKIDAIYVAVLFWLGNIFLKQ